MSPKIESWQSLPIENEIITMLLNNRGELLTTDIYRTLANSYEDFSRNDLTDLLFRLEVRGFVYVTPIKKDVAKVEIRRSGKFSNEVLKQISRFGAQ